jgi:hypothetical protein
MARGVTTLSQCVDKFRKEIRAATSPAQNQPARAGYVHILQRVQRQLWTDHLWPFLKVRRDKVLQAGQQLYSFPSDLKYEQVRKVEVKHGGKWYVVEPGIDSGHYNLLDPEEDIRQDPVLRWQVYEDDQIEVWPLPATNGSADGDGRLRLWGNRDLDAFVSNDDVTTLDDDLIVLYGAAEYMAGNGQKDAAAKLQDANKLLVKLLGNNTKPKPFKLGGGIQDESPPMRAVTTYVRAEN